MNGPFFLNREKLRIFNHKSTTKMIRKDSKLIEPKLSYEIIGIAYTVFKKLGFGYQEKYYQRAFEIELKGKDLKYRKENYIDLEYKNQKIGDYFLDFLVEDKIIIELKTGEYFHNKDFSQAKAYLNRTGLKLGILILFGPKGVKFERILNNKILQRKTANEL